MNSIKVKLYSFIVFLLGSGLFMSSIKSQYYFDLSWIEIIIFILLSVALDYLPVDLPLIGSVTVNFALDFAMILIFGLPTAAMVAALSYCIYALLNSQGEMVLSKLLFNIGQIVTTVILAGSAYIYFGGSVGMFKYANILPALFAIIVYLLINTGLVTILYSLLINASLSETLISNIKWAVPNYLVLGALGFLIAFLYEHMSMMGVMVLFVPLLLARHTFKLYMDMRNMYLNTIQGLAATIDAKDHYTAGHSSRVSEYVVAMAKEMGFPERRLEHLKYASMLHDIGKIAIPDGILNNTGKLDDEAWEKMQSHVVAGSDIVSQISFLNAELDVKHHHERYGGGGYPDGLKGEEIPLGARIIAVADAFDAMTTDRPYRKGLAVEVAFQELIRGKGFQFDPEIADVFMKVYERDFQNPLGRIVEG